MIEVHLRDIFSQVQLLPVTNWTIAEVFFVCILLAMSAFASGSEIAIFSLSPAHLNIIKEKKNRQDIILNRLRDDSERTLATILIANNLINVGIIMLCNHIFATIIYFGEVRWLHFLCLTILLTFFLLLFGEVMPKACCSANPLKYSRKAAPVILLLKRILSPASSILMKSGVFATKIIHPENRPLSTEELEQALRLTNRDDIKDERKLLEGIVRFGEETAQEIMTYRQDMVALDIKTSYFDVLKSIAENNYSRIPVYRNSMDDIRGVLYIKDLLPHLGKPNNFRWQSLIRPPYFIPETKNIDDLLREFQDNKVHMSIVVDEFGGTSGIVTLEDILEEIVGEINDEYDDEEKAYIRLNGNTYIFEGKTLLSDFRKATMAEEVSFDGIEGGADTLAGLLISIKGDFPKLHEKIECVPFTFEVMEIEGHRLSKIKVISHIKHDNNQQKGAT